MATPGPSRRKKNDKNSATSFDEQFELDANEASFLGNKSESVDKMKDVIESFSEMTDEEMLQHMKLCVKLSSENKINAKNAFGLHLIRIMQKIVNKEKVDIQQASLSLQASSKIYAGRVESLYQDTVKFQGHLSSIVSGGKKDKKSKSTEEETDDADEDGSKKKVKPHKSKCKSFSKSEESLRLQEVTTSSSLEPHGNFVTINSAFSTSRLAPRLLSCLQPVDDSCMLRCAIPESCFKPKTALSHEPFPVAPKLKALLEKIKNFDAQSEFQVPSTTFSTPFNPHMSTSKFATPSGVFNDEDDGLFAVPNDLPAVQGSADDAISVESAIERFDILNITANIFVNDIAAAVTDQGTVDQRLLPPNSTIKKMLDKSKRSSIKPSAGKTLKKKVKEPFFAGKSAAAVKHLFVKGKATTLSKKTLEEWSKKESITIIDSGYELLQELEKNKDEEHQSSATAERLFDVIEQNVPWFRLQHYFNKQSQIWKFSRKKFCMNEAIASTPYRNQTERRVGSTVPGEPEDLVLSFQNLSLHESMHEIPDSAENSSFSEPPPNQVDIEEQQFVVPPNQVDIEEQQFVVPPDEVDEEEQQFVVPPDSFDIDIEELMVKPPELVRPAKMKFDERPVNLDMDKMKDLLWFIISRHLEKKANEDRESFILFSVAYKELKLKLEREISETISIQFVFVVLLILANQKTLLIQNADNTDLRISQDISEIEVSDNM